MGRFAYALGAVYAGQRLTSTSTNLIQRQRQYQMDPRPVYQRLPRSGLYMTVFQIVFWTGTLGVAAGYYNMATVCVFMKGTFR